MPLFIKTSCILVVLLFVNVCLAQTTSLQLRIVDQNDALIPNASIKLKKDHKLVKDTIYRRPQTVEFSNILVGIYTVEIEATGFKDKSIELEIKAGRNDLTINLEINEIVENVSIDRDSQEKGVDKAFSGFMTKAEIAALSDDPKEIERELKNRYGEDAIIRVNGFGSKIPTKSQIASIRTSASSFDAENHELGSTYIDIVTRIGNQQWTGSLNVNFNDESFNARNPFSASRLPEQFRYYDIFLMGPIKKNSSTFYAWIGNTTDIKKENIIAVLPSGKSASSVNRVTNTPSLNLSISQNLPKEHVARLNYNFFIEKSKNLGIGGFDLEERGYSSTLQYHQIQFSESGYIGKKFLNELKFEFTTDSSKILPNSEEKSIIVLDAFNRGGSGNASDTAKKSFWFSDNLLFGVKKHAFKTGGLIYFERKDETSRFNQNGTFTFSSLSDFVSGTPSIFTQSPGTRKSEVSQVQIGAFIQDDYRIKKNLGLSFGLRYEWQNNLKDPNNFSPRFGVTWSPLKNGKLTLRGGAGIFYNWLETYILSSILNQDSSQPSETIILNPTFPNPFMGGTSQPLPKSFWGKADNIKNPYVIHSSFALESPISKSLSLRSSYTFQKGVHQVRVRNINAPLQGIRPLSNFGNITQLESSAFFVRNSLRIDLSGNLQKNTSFGLSYTLAKKLSDSDGIFSMPSDNYNLRADRSASNDDQRHRIFTSLSWSIAKGLRLSSVFSVNSPLPYTITTGRDGNRDTIFNDRPNGTLRNSERGKWRSQLDMGLSWTFSFVNRTGEKTGTTVVTVSQSEVGSGQDSTDEKKKFSLKLYVSGRNILNQTNFRSFTGVQTSPYFRLATFAENPRKLVVGLNFNF